MVGGGSRTRARVKEKNGGGRKDPATHVVISCLKTKAKLFWQYSCIFSPCVFLKIQNQDYY